LLCPVLGDKKLCAGFGFPERCGACARYSLVYSRSIEQYFLMLLKLYFLTIGENSQW
jgi:hypothetical protein